ncbi:MAG: hypothetical protein AB8B64_12820 [Granulosicoccus sp.]
MNSQDFSSAFIGTKRSTGTDKEYGFATLNPIDEVFRVDRSENDSKIWTEQIGNVLTYLDPILSDKDTFAALKAINPELFDGFDKFEIRPDKGVIELSPVLDALETNQLSEVARGLLTDNIKGIALYSFISSLRYAIWLDVGKSIVESSGNFKPGVLCERPGLGKISQWSFNPKSGVGFIRIDDMKVDRYRLGFDGNKLTYRLEEQSSYTWNISIVEPGYDEAERMSLDSYKSATSNGEVVDPFITTTQRTPGNLQHPSLPEKAKDPANTEDSIWARGLNRRLTAYGSAIKIESITEKRFAMVAYDKALLGDDASLPLYIDALDDYYVRGQVLTDTYTLTGNHPYLQTSKESCIDIMFADIFPRHIAEFPGDQTGWCLGRCSHPVIENSK